MTEIWVPITVALIGGIPLGALGRVLIDWIRGKHREEDDAWKQRDRERRRADKLHEVLMRHRTWCHMHHKSSYDDMPAFPRAE